jgi:peptidyl-prolyl cis-trans isomerase SurA
MKTVFSLLVFMLPVICLTQDLSDKILMTVAGENVSAGEFIRMYNKSNVAGIPSNIVDYLQQYIIFKLKVADAISEGLDTTIAFCNEFNGYRNQLAQNYLTDSNVKEKLLRETYQRSLTEIKARHILISCPSTANPEDTLNAWKKAAEIKERINSGESFEQVARATSDDPSVKINGGNLGYFTVFQMITPFEDAAYNLKTGRISDPVRTPFGYHIIQVTDKREARGKILVAHIMKAAPPGIEENEAEKAEESIRTIYSELKKGVSFSELARKYSDHKESAAIGGKMNWFGAGEIITEFTEAAFSISDTGLYTKPVRTPYGWHIIKLLDKKPHGSFEQTRSYLESRMNQSHLNSLSKKSFVNTLKKEYNFKINQQAYKWFINNTDTLIIRGQAKYNRSHIPAGNLYSFANQNFTANNFAGYIEKRGLMIITDDPVTFVNEAMEMCVSDQILKYENSILENKYTDFRYLMKEFHDGILLFEISGKKVWNRVSEDSTGLMRYYEQHKHENLSRKGIDAKIYTYKGTGKEKKFYSAYRRYSRKRDCDKLILEKYNDSTLVITEGEWYTGDNPELDRIKWVKGAHTCTINGFPSIVVIRRIIEEKPLPFEAVAGDMLMGYQDYLESEWIMQLKSKYNVNVDDHVFLEIKKTLKNE